MHKKEVSWKFLKPVQPAPMDHHSWNSNYESLFKALEKESSRHIDTFYAWAQRIQDALPCDQLSPVNTQQSRGDICRQFTLKGKCVEANIMLWATDALLPSYEGKSASGHLK